MATMEILNKVLTKVIFSDATNLNLSAQDFGEAMTHVKILDPVTTRLPAAAKSIVSANLYVRVEVPLSVLKTSAVYKEYALMIKQRAAIGGTLTLYDDRGFNYTATDVAFNVEELPEMNGTNNAVTFIATANFQVNELLMGGSV